MALFQCSASGPGLANDGVSVCKFKHDPSTEGKGHENGLTTRLAAMAAMPCHAFAVGKCRWGDKCRYKHSGESEVKVGLGLGLGSVGSGEDVRVRRRKRSSRRRANASS